MLFPWFSYAFSIGWKKNPNSEQLQSPRRDELIKARDKLESQASESRSGAEPEKNHGAYGDDSNKKYMAYGD